MNARARAAQLLAPVLQRKRSFELPQLQSDAALCAELCYGTLRWLPRLKVILDNLLSKPLRSKDADIEALLLLGLYQIEHLRIPDHAAVSETAGAARTLGKSWAVKLINGVLRSFLRKQKDLDQSLGPNPAYRFAHPAWLVESLQHAWPDQADNIFNAGNQRPPMTLRVNRLRTDRDAYLKELAASGLSGRAGERSPDAIVLDQPVPVESLPGFAEGLVSIQDEAAQLAALLLQAQEGETVLDACAAPGGKTGHILEMEPNCFLWAVDSDSERLQKVADNLVRLRLHARLECLDAGDADRLADLPGFNRILLDAPCSGTGVIRRHPDIKWLRRPTDISSFVDQQQRLLRQLWAKLQPNGLLLYVTCSIMPGENAELIARFVDERTDVRPLDPGENWGLAAGHGRQLLPTPQGSDGFYFALLEKQSGNA